MTRRWTFAIIRERSVPRLPAEITVGATNEAEARERAQKALKQGERLGDLKEVE